MPQNRRASKDEVIRCGYVSKCKARRCLERATLTAEKVDGASRRVRQFHLRHCDFVIKRERAHDLEICDRQYAPDQCILKEFENRCHMVALYAVWYNFIRIHKTLRVTPEMEAGVTDRLFSFDDLIGIVNEWEIERHEN